LSAQAATAPRAPRGASPPPPAPTGRKVGPGGSEKICMGTTPWGGLVGFTEPLGEQYGVRAICGKGGFPDEAIEPMQRLGMVYFAIVGGAAALQTTQIEEIEEDAREGVMPQWLECFPVKEVGPPTGGMYPL